MSIISLIVFLLFSTFMKQLAVHNETSNKIAEFSIFKNNFKREVYFSNNITKYQDNVIISLNDTLDIIYQFKNDYVIKKINNNTDTIFLQLSQFDTTLNMEDKITQFKFKFLLFNEPILLGVNKEYVSNSNLENQY